MGANQSSFRMEYIGIDLLQLVTTFVVVAVTGGCGEAGGGYAILSERGQDLGLVVFRNLVNGVKTRSEPGDGFLAVSINGRGDAHFRIHFSNCLHIQSSFSTDWKI